MIAASAAGAASKLELWLQRSLARPVAPLVLLGVIVLLATGARVFHLDVPGPSRAGGGLIFDERYYVNAARVIAGVPMSPLDTYFGAAPPGSDPNGEHPQLGKVAMAAFIRLLGDNPVSWRLSAVLVGLLSLLLLYWLVRCAGGSAWLALGATAIAATENLWLVSSRIGVLDIFCIPFMLAGTAFYLRRQPVVAGVVLGFGAAVKEFTVYALLAVVVLEALRLARALAQRSWPPAGEVTRRALRPALTVSVTLLAFFSLLTLMDVAVTPYSGGRAVDVGQSVACDRLPIWGPACNHFVFMNRYAAGLRSPAGPQGIAAYPWQFWLDQKAIDYYSTSRTVIAGTRVVAIQPILDFEGVITPVVLFTGWIAIIVHLWWAFRRRDDLTLLVLAWVAATWAPPAIFSLVDQRITYLYYMVVTLPALFIADARLLGGRAVPGWLRGVFAGLLLAGFAALYPIRTLTGT